MRKLTLEDIRLSPGSNVIAAPMWAYEMRRGNWEPIEEVWADVRAELDRRLAEMPKTEGAGITRRLILRWMRCRLLRGAYGQQRECLICGERFMASKSGYRAVACTDKCAKARRKQTHVYSMRSRVSHDLQPCRHCGEPFRARRSDALYCSGKCRGASYRKSRGVGAAQPPPDRT